MKKRLRLFTAITALALAAIVLPHAASAQSEKRVALVIGNDRYANLPADRQLLKAVNDAEAMGDALAKLGFTVIRGQNLGRQGMIDKLSAFTAQLEAGDTAAFFYAGHGVAIGGVNYLVPSDVPSVTPDAEARVRGNSIAEGDVVAEIQGKGARVALLVLDACRDNPFPRSGTRSIGNTRGLADAKPARGMFTIYSAGIGQTALDRLGQNDPDRNSVFTRVFVEHMTRPGVHLGELAFDVREEVARLALKARNPQGEPAPHEQTPAYYDQTIGGRVFLAGRAIGVEPRAEPAAPPQAQPEQDSAAQAWAVTQNTTSIAVLEDFIRQFGTTVYGSLARARLDELKKSQTPIIARPVAPAVPQETAPKPVEETKATAIKPVAQEPDKPAPAKAAAPSAQKPSDAKPSGCGKVVGVWTWTDAFNSVETYRADGTVVSTSNPQTGRWRCTGNQVVIHWPDGKVERQTALSDFTKLHYVNPLGIASVGTKR